MPDLSILRDLLGQEGSDFYRHDRRWRPQDLIPEPYRRNLLVDAEERLRQLEDAEDELQQLERANLYIGTLKRLRLTVRRAKYAWRADDLEFIKAIAEFFSEYGTVIQYLKFDEARGRLGKTQKGV